MRKAMLISIFTLVGCYNNAQMPSKNNTQNVAAYIDQFGFAKNPPLVAEPKSEYTHQQKWHHQYIQNQMMQREKENQHRLNYKNVPKSYTTIPVSR